MPVLQCHVCGAPVTIDEPIPRDAECGSCRNDLRCCRNCRHWDPRYTNECTETMADPVTDKDRRNFCEYFYFSREPFAGATRGSGGADAARAKLDALFRKPGETPAADRAAEARRRLDSLFGGRPGGDSGKGPNG